MVLANWFASMFGFSEKLDEILAAAEPSLRADIVEADSRAATVKQRPTSRRITPAEISVREEGLWWAREGHEAPVTCWMPTAKDLRWGGGFPRGRGWGETELQRVGAQLGVEELTWAFCAQIRDWQREGHQNRSGARRAALESLGWLQFSGCEAGN